MTPCGPTHDLLLKVTPPRVPRHLVTRLRLLSGDARLAGLSPLAQGGALRERFVELLLAPLDPADVAFLTRIAIVEALHAGLCRALTGAGDAPERLARLVRDTPVFVAAEGSDWLRMHSLAREVLRERFAALPAADAARLRLPPSKALTPKEREVLELLTRNLSNKEIGLAMQVGEATIKWHMKNLFAKLDAGTRKQVVQRVRILGLLEFE